MCVRQRREIVEGTGRRADGRRVQIGSSITVMQSKYLDKRQEVIMRTFCCSLPVFTSMSLRAFGAGSVTGHAVFYFPLKDQFMTLTKREGRGFMRRCEGFLLIICKTRWVTVDPHLSPRTVLLLRICFRANMQYFPLVRGSRVEYKERIRVEYQTCQ